MPLLAEENNKANFKILYIFIHIDIMHIYSRIKSLVQKDVIMALQIILIKRKSIK